VCAGGFVFLCVRVLVRLRVYLNVRVYVMVFSADEHLVFACYSRDLFFDSLMCACVCVCVCMFGQCMHIHAISCVFVCVQFSPITCIHR